MTQTAKYNRLVLIGNGFDLALGLKTSYSAFILDYLKQSINKFNENNPIDTNLLTILLGPKTTNIEEHKVKLLECSSMHELLLLIKEGQILRISYKYPFFGKIVTQLGDANWVDIEGLYYSTLESQIHSQKKLTTEQKKFGNILYLNDCMDHISLALEEYLIKEQEGKNIGHLGSHLSGLMDRVFEPPFHRKEKLRITGNINTAEPNSVMFLNFNYTNSLRLLLGNTFGSKAKIIPIHGSLSNGSYPPIFGYGDDTGSEYKEIESLRNDDILRKIKSFEYSKADHYHNLLDFIDANKFDVFIIGHSCGLSDKTMLKSIFEHNNCRAIKNFHYSGKDENFRKGIAISRHFNDKALFRERLLPFDETAKIPQSK